MCTHRARSTFYLRAPEHPRNAEATFKEGLPPTCTRIVNSANYFVRCYEWGGSAAWWGKGGVLSLTEMHFLSSAHEYVLIYKGIYEVWSKTTVTLNNKKILLQWKTHCHESSSKYSPPPPARATCSFGYSQGMPSWRLESRGWGGLRFVWLSVYLKPSFIHIQVP